MQNVGINQLLDVLLRPCGHIAQGPGCLLLDGGLGVQQEPGQHTQYSRVNGHLGLVIGSRDDVPHSAERGGLEEQG